MDKVWLLGVGGSVSISDPRRAEYGGATTCILVRLDGQYVLLDAGTGILRLPEEVMEEPSLTMLLTHYHLDHLIGLPMCPYLRQKGRSLTIWGGSHDGRDAGETLERLFSSPLWPVSLWELPCRVEIRSLTEQCFSLGSIRVDVMRGSHPNGVNVFRLTGREHSVVLATDCTLTPEIRPALTAFARDCDLLLCDGQYSSAEWVYRAGFGHNTWNAAAALGRDCGARALRVIHHDPDHSDKQLSAAQAEVETVCPTGRLGREGEEIVL